MEKIVDVTWAFGSGYLSLLLLSTLFIWKKENLEMKASTFYTFQMRFLNIISNLHHFYVKNYFPFDKLDYN